MKVLILGLGYTGLRLGRSLQKKGIAIIGSNRSGNQVSGTTIPIVTFDSGRPDSFDPNFWNQNPDITHILSTMAPTPEGKDPAWEVLKHHPNPNMLSWTGYLSTTGVYGDTKGAWVDELSAVQPGNRRSQARVSIEQQWLQSDFPSHIFRLPGIYGPTRSIFERIRSGRVQHIIKPGHVFSRVHVDDIVQTLTASMQQPSRGEIYNVVDDEPSEPKDLLLEGAALLEVQPPPPIKFEDAEFSPMGRSFWDECRRVSNQKIKEKLGIQILFPSYREGLRAILNER